MQDYVLKNDIQYLLSNKVNMEELKILLDTKMDLSQFEEEV